MRSGPQGSLTEQVQLHPSRVVRFIGMPPPDQMLSGQTWGDSVLQALNDTVKMCGLVSGSLATLISEMKIDIIKVPELTEILSTKEGESKLIERFSAANATQIGNQHCPARWRRGMAAGSGQSNGCARGARDLSADCVGCRRHTCGTVSRSCRIEV